jgi:hypothetical protein
VNKAPSILLCSFLQLPSARPLVRSLLAVRLQEICRLLLEAKANVNAKTLRGFTPMHFAMHRGACVRACVKV